MRKRVGEVWSDGQDTVLVLASERVSKRCYSHRFVYLACGSAPFLEGQERNWGESKGNSWDDARWDMRRVL